MPCLDTSNHGRHPADNNSYKQNLKTAQMFEVDAGSIQNTNKIHYFNNKEEHFISWNNSPMASVECPPLEFLQ